MGWLDDLKTRVEQETGNFTQSIESYVKSQARDAVVKIGNEQLGNLNQLQLDQGKSGAGAAAAAPSGAFGGNAMQVSQIQDAFTKYMPILAIGGILYFLLKSKRRG